MDFFDHQERARRRSLVLLAAFLATVTATVGAVALVTGLAVVWAGAYFGAPAVANLREVPWPVYAWAAGLAAAVVGIATARRMAELSGAGDAVAHLVGARALAPDTTHPARQRLRNVVEELAIAAGTPVPRLYLMDDEPAINAFAAGSSPRGAVLAVTAGALEHLTRDELQGVVAHEFSHIVHGDMRLNVRLIGLLGGVGAVGELGMWLVRGAFGRRGRLGLPQLLGGAVLAAVGSAGVLVGRVARAAIAREREFLADASAVQYTRNPAGIGGALQRIAAGPGSALLARRAPVLSHMLFGGDGHAGLARLLDSHPPLATRIARIFRVSDARYAPRPAPRPAVPNTAPAPVRIAGMQAAIGTLTAPDLAAAHALLDGLPEALRSAARAPERIAGLVCALLLDADPRVRATQTALVSTALGDEMAERMARYAGALATVPAHRHLPLIELCAPGLGGLQAAQARSLEGLLTRLVAANGRTGQFEYLLFCLVWRCLPGRAGPARRGGPVPLEAARAQCQLVLSAVAHAGTQGDAGFAAGWAQLGLGPSAPIAPGLINPTSLARALEHLAALRPAHLARVVRACVAAVLHDGQIDVAESDVLGGVCAALDAPLPLLAGAAAPTVTPMPTAMDTATDTATIT